MFTKAALDGEPLASAEAADLNYAHDSDLGIVRKRHGKAFRYATVDGQPVRDRDTLERMRTLAIPPAWTDVWISPDPSGHLQATGRDARGRKQYRYHTRWRTVRDAAKYHRLVEFCRALPAIREAVARDLACTCLCRRKVIATVVSLMEHAQLRVGNDEYARENGSYGATTLRDRHARIHGDTLELSYRAKGGIQRRVKITDRRLARIVRRCRDLPGQRLFQFVDGGGAPHPITSSDVNAYLHEVSGGPFTAKDYRTWAATLGMTMLLCRRAHPASATAAKRCVMESLRAVAERLGHTPTVCRSSYIHPRVIDDFTAGTLAGKLARDVERALKTTPASAIDGIALPALRSIEPVVARYLESR